MSSSFGFSKNSGPGGPQSGPITFGGLNPDISAAPRFPSPNLNPRSFEAVVRSPSSMPTPRFSPAHSPRSPPAYSQPPPPPPPYVASNSAAASFPRGGLAGLSQRRSFPTPPGPISSKVSPSQVSETSRRSPVYYNEDFLNDPINDATEGLEDITVNHYVASQRRQSPFTAAASNDSIINPTASLNKPQRPSFSPPMSSSRFSAISDSQYNQRTSSSAYEVNGDATGIRVPNPSLAERSRSPPVEANVTRLPNNPLNKRTRSPPAATGQVFLRSSPSTENDTEREEQAKAKRLARFKTELDEAEPGVLVQRGPDVPQNKKSSSLKSVENKNSMEDLSMDYDNEDLQSSNIIVGLCPDMCPVSERGERERKGDLDRYERLDGDRNHTSKILAVKKYNRTAEREAALIRPMPILQKTMDYLLGLLDQPYDDSLLGLYNFLWDRMRAIRMDLRMQHIFNLKAITMLEQMIRLHVIAMHELCEFSKGEGFSEGFDAHLNIEQMNKTSVELFQLYDDHRKKGIFIPTEKEFRGYYALLKLDKHPGYKVEPAELSLDLAKMTAEIRQTQEILFARDVARSCRTGNFIAFFRHARKASYLQACLMHAHFSKLRTQALASLHSGLQLKQGLPVTLVATWLGMEGEDVESLLEYHGFMIKEFEEPYMVKDGPFLHDDKDYPTRCSTLVHRKKSNTIVQDVSSSHEIILSPKPSQLDMFSKKKYVARQLVQTERHLNVSVDGDMEIEAVSSPRGTMQSEPVFDKSSGTQVGLVSGSRFGQASNDHQRVSAVSPRSNSRVSKGSGSVRSPGRQEKPSPFTLNNSTLIFSDGQLSDKNIPMTFSTDLSGLAPHTPSLAFAKQDEFRGPFQSSPNSIVHPDLGTTPSTLVATDVRELALSDLEGASVRATSPKHGIFMEELAAEKYTDVHEKVEADDVESNFDKEVAEAKLRLLLRLWRRRFVRKKKLQEEKRLAANAALSSLSRGPPLWQTKDKPVHSPMLNIDKAMHERHGKLQESRIRWNISDLVASKLAERNANSNCVCWKVISFSWFYHGTYDTRARSFLTYPSLDEWLQYKLFPSFKDETIEGLAMSAPGLSVWRKWSPTDSGDIACYFSVIKDITSGNSATNLAGASAILFPISKMVPHDVQRTQLHNLAMSLPTEASIPVLIICGSRQELDFVAKLGLEELDNSRVGSYSIICLNEGEGADRFHGYFSNQKLKDGLIWLASESRPQPVLSCVTTRELALMQLNSSLYALHPRECDRVGPNQCISAFNDALDQTINNIITASKANPTGWPCPEVFLLDKSAVEFRAVKKFLPNLGWSSLGEIEPLISDLRNCKLPYFSGDLSWLSKGCTLEEEIEEQRQLLQNCLINYLTQTSNVMHLMLAVKEATLMVQKHTRIELRDTEFKMVPSWVLMFKRLFNWQLNSAASFTRKAYVLDQGNLTCNPKFLQSDLDVEIHRFSVHPSLDEMVQVSCSPIVSKRVRSSPNSLRNAVARTSAVTLSNHVSEEKNYHSEIQIHSVDGSDIPTLNSDLNMVTRNEKKDDRLTELLNQCDMLQDEIEKRLSIYF